MDGHQRQSLVGEFGSQVAHRMHRRKPPVGLVAAVMPHGVGVGQAGERHGNLMPGHFADALDQGLDGFENALLLRKRHLDIDLRELGLAVGAEIFVAETAHDLEVFFEAAHHEELFENLRRLRQGIERARVDAAGNQVVARALGRGAPHERRFDFQESLCVERLAHRQRNLRTAG